MKNKIMQLKKQKNAVILAHYYAPAEVQEVADYVGDSFYLAKIAKESPADILVLCGVAFMGESAKLLNPTKRVLMPDATADCPMAHMVAPGVIEKMREKYDDLAVVCYINSTAALKCQSDVCVTSSNALRVVNALPNRNIFFIPDKNLGSYVANQITGKNVYLNDGCCPIHAEMTAAQLQALRALHPSAAVLAHPECREEVLAVADCIGSTSELIAYAKASDKTEFIVGTEVGVLWQLQQDSPEKTFYFPEPVPLCAGMKQNTLKRLLSVLENENDEIKISDEVQQRAVRPLERMLELAK